MLGTVSFTYYLISRGFFKIIINDYGWLRGGGWGLAVDYVIKIFIYTL